MNATATPPTPMTPLPAPPTGPPWPGRLGVITTLTVLLITATIAAAGTRHVAPGVARLAPGTSPTAATSGEPLPVTINNLHGAWYMPALADGSLAPLLARFNPDGTFSFDGIRKPTANPNGNQEAWVSGDFQARPTGMTFHPTGGWCGATDNFAWHVIINTTGRMQAVHLGSNGADRNTIGHCTVLVGATYDLSRVSPRSPAANTIHGEHLAPNRAITAADQSSLAGYWLIRGTGLLIHLTPTSYVMDNTGNLGAGALDTGTFTITDHTLKLASGPTTTACPTGNDLTITDAHIQDGQLQGTVDHDHCHRGLNGPIALLHLDPTRP